MRKLEKQYGSLVAIEEWQRDVYAVEKKQTPIYSNCCLSCNAGNLNWAMNEKGMMKPCVMLPEQDNLMWKYSDWKKYVRNKSRIYWDQYVKKYREFCLEKGVNPLDYCESMSVIKN